MQENLTKTRRLEDLPDEIQRCDHLNESYRWGHKGNIVIAEESSFSWIFIIIIIIIIIISGDGVNSQF